MLPIKLTYTCRPNSGILCGFMRTVTRGDKVGAVTLWSPNYTLEPHVEWRRLGSSGLKPMTQARCPSGYET